MLRGWGKILHLIFSLNHDDNMPPSLKCDASTSDAIFWCGTPAPLFTVVQPIKYVFAFLRLRVRARFWRRLREVATTWPLGDSESHQGV